MTGPFPRSWMILITDDPYPGVNEGMDRSQAQPDTQAHTVEQKQHKIFVVGVSHTVVHPTQT